MSIGKSNKITISFDIDLKELFDANQGDCLLPEDFDEMIVELVDMYAGKDLGKGLSEDAKRDFEDQFTGMFNY